MVKKEKRKEKQIYTHLYHRNCFVSHNHAYDLNYVKLKSMNRIDHRFYVELKVRKQRETNIH